MKIQRDAFGIPHLRAGDHLQLAFLQGYEVAVERGWQLEVERQRARGTSAAWLGPEEVGWDRLARQAKLDDTARRCWQRLDEETRAYVGRFVDGVNAGMKRGLAASPAPGEEARASERPAWQAWEPHVPLALWLSTHLLFAGLPGKLFRTEVLRRLGPERGAQALAWLSVDGGRGAASNGLLVTAERSASGGALVAGDPHRFLELPGCYRQVHLVCPEYDVIGFAIPGVPGVAHFGQSERVAWAITHAMADYQDVYEEELVRQGDRVLARGPGGAEEVERSVEHIAVRGGPPMMVELLETARGPIIAGGPDEGFALSLRTVPRVTGALGFEVLPQLLRARSVAELDRALEAWVEPVNVVLAADAGGATLHRVAGKVPLRAEENRQRSVAAWAPEHGWRGFMELPRRQVADVAVMANARGLAGALGVEFDAPYREARLAELLRGQERWGSDELAGVLLDDRAGGAAPLLAALAGCAPEASAAARLRAELLAWDQRMDAASSTAAAFARWRAALAVRLAAHQVLAPLRDLGRHERVYPEVLLPWFDVITRVGVALPQLLASALLPAAEQRALLCAALDEVAALDDDAHPRRTVSWGELHRAVPWQAAPRPLPVLDEALGPSGDFDCVLATSSFPGRTHACLRGPAARFVWDVADRRRSRWSAPFGASGRPDSPHFLDQLTPWLRGELSPVVTELAALLPAEDLLMSDLSPRPRLFEHPRPGLGLVWFSPVNPAADIDLIDGWVKEERAQFWGMRDHSKAYVQEIYEYLDSLSTHHAYLVFLNDEPVALLQTYQPAADPVGQLYPVVEGDLGVHALLGPSPSAKVPGFTAHLAAAFRDFVFSDPAVQRVVIEPDVRNGKALARVAQLGFTLGAQIELPDKRAQLAFLSRQAARPLPLAALVS